MHSAGPHEVIVRGCYIHVAKTSRNRRKLISYRFARLFLCIYHFLTTQNTSLSFFHQFIDLEESIFDLKTYFGFTGEPLHQILFYVNLIILVGEILQKMRAHSLGLIINFVIQLLIWEMEGKHCTNNFNHSISLCVC